MANKRDLKKFVRRSCGMVAGECVLALEFVDGVDRAKMGEALVNCADLQAASLEMITFAFDKTKREFDTPASYNKARRAYFKGAYNKFFEDFMTHLEAIVEKMNEALPKAEKEARK